MKKTAKVAKSFIMILIQITFQINILHTFSRKSGRHSYKLNSYKLAFPVLGSVPVLALELELELKLELELDN